MSWYSRLKEDYGFDGSEDSSDQEGSFLQYFVVETENGQERIVRAKSREDVINHFPNIAIDENGSFKIQSAPQDLASQWDARGNAIDAVFAEVAIRKRASRMEQLDKIKEISKKAKEVFDDELLDVFVLEDNPQEVFLNLGDWAEDHKAIMKPFERAGFSVDYDYEIRTPDKRVWIRL